MENIKSEIVTIFHLIIIYTLFFGIAIIVSNLLNFSVDEFDMKNYKNRSLFIIFLEILFEILILCISAFYSSLLISNIIMPFNVDLSRATNIHASSGIIISFMMMMFQTNLKQKIKFLYEKFTDRKI